MLYNVLIIDDEDTICEIIQLVLEGPIYNTKTLIHVRNLEEVILDFKPHIILLDIMLGLADGRVVCKKIKSDPNSKNIPVILLTASLIDQQSLNCGQDAFLEKPFNIDELERLVWDTIQQSLVIPITINANL